MRFQLLGEVQATRDGRQVDLGPVRQRSVLAALLVDVNEPVSVDDLVDRVWGDEPPETARGTLYSYLSRLRQMVVIERTRGGGQRLVADPGAVDLVEFRAHIAAGRHEEALALWRGEPLGGLATPWAVTVRETLAGERFAAALGVAERHLHAGKHAEVVAALSPLSADHPLDERLAALLMQAMTATGRQAEALRLYERLRHDLSDELGVDPGPELQDLYQRILRGEPVTAAKPVAVPQQLLAPPPSFVGRTAELARLDQAGEVVIISGAGGIGKTWLALHWAHRDKHRFPDGQLYVNLRGFDPSGRPMTAETALRGFLEGLGVQPSEVPTDVDAQAALYRSLLAGRRVLVLVDNAADSAQVALLLPGGGSTVVVTSRDQLTGLVAAHGARRLTLDALPKEDAAELLAARIGMARFATEPEAANELVDGCAGMPLALSIIAGRAEAHPEFPLAALAAELRQAGLNALDDDDPLASVRAVLSLSTDALKPAEARLFALLGLAPGPDIGVQAAAALSGVTEAEVGRTLRALERVSLVQQHVPGRYRMHDLVRLYAGEQELPRADRNAALHGLVNYYTYGAYAVGRKLFPHRAASALVQMPTAPIEYDPPDNDAAWAWFRAENACLMATARLAMRMGWHNAVWQQAWYMGPLRSRQAHIQDDHEAWRMALDAAEQIGNTSARAFAHVGFGFACRHIGDLDRALSNLELALDLLAGTDLTLEKAVVHAGVAYVLRAFQRDPEALEHARRGLALLEPIGAPVITAQARSQVGELLVAIGENEAGRATLEQALAVFREHGDLDSEAITMANVARSHYQQGDLPLAVALYRDVIRMYAAAGNSYPLGMLHNRLGDILLELGDRPGAVEQWRRAVDSHLSHHSMSEAAQVRTKLADIN